MQNKRTHFKNNLGHKQTLGLFTTVTDKDNAPISKPEISTSNRMASSTINDKFYEW